MTNYYIPITYIVPLISVDGQASPRLFIAPEICHEKISYQHDGVLESLLILKQFKCVSLYLTALSHDENLEDCWQAIVR